jgi:lipoprotein-anchoring transpeptidase ErfK/SrfK
MSRLTRSTLIVTGVLALGLLGSACRGPGKAEVMRHGAAKHHQQARAQQAQTATTTATALGTTAVSAAPTIIPTPTPSVPASPAVTTTLATAIGTIPDYAQPNGSTTGSVPATWHGSPSILPVLAEKTGWVEVRLAPRPNGSTAWVKASDVSLTYSPWSIVVDTENTHFYLYEDGKLVDSMPAGVGTAGDPTPHGTFFVAYFAPPPSSGYGPFVMVTSAHSNNITDWESSGDAQIAIHGPLGGDQLIGSQGAAISHGCVRLHLSGLALLRNVPAGSPVVVL